MSAKTTPIGPFAGINNRLPDHQLAVVERGRKAGDYLRDALNVDITNAGTLIGRSPTTRARPGEFMHSLWSDGRDHCYVADTTLMLNGMSVREGMRRAKALAYVRYTDGGIYWSDGYVLERLAGGVSHPAAPPRPNPSPVLELLSAGALPEGRYQACVTLLNGGVESPPSWPQQVFCQEGRGLRLSSMPPGEKNVYISTCNGDVLFHYATTSAVQLDIPVLPADLGHQLLTQDYDALPPGRILATFSGRLLSASGSTLYIGEPYAGAIYNPMKGYIPFPDEITMVAPLDTGFFVGTSEATYWCSGRSTDEIEVVLAKNEGVSFGTSWLIYQDQQSWRSDKGVCLGAPDGSVTNIQEKSVAVAKGVAGATLYREHNGLRQIVSVNRLGDPTKAFNKDYAEVIDRIARTKA